MRQSKDKHAATLEVRLARLEAQEQEIRAELAGEGKKQADRQLARMRFCAVTAMEGE
jgi:hypothetical protein